MFDKLIPLYSEVGIRNDFADDSDRELENSFISKLMKEFPLVAFQSGGLTSFCSNTELMDPLLQLAGSGKFHRLIFER